MSCDSCNYMDMYDEATERYQRAEAESDRMLNLVASQHASACAAHAEASRLRRRLLAVETAAHNAKHAWFETADSVRTEDAMRALEAVLGPIGDNSEHPSSVDKG